MIKVKQITPADSLQSPPSGTAKMLPILKIGKALYKVDYEARTYWYHGRNPVKTSRDEELRNKRKIDGFTRIFRDGKKKKYIFKTITM